MSAIYQAYTYYRILKKKERNLLDKIILVYPTIENLEKMKTLKLNVDDNVEIVIIKIPLDEKPSREKLASVIEL